MSKKYDWLRLNYEDLLQPTSAVRNARALQCGKPLDAAKLQAAQQRFFALDCVLGQRVR
ncbi:MAG: hypothetical protein K2L95_02310 [Alphaproteobacteria bacterium]|nr:hypothetical protein [Alphaproteobacteria bacterium]MDE6571030.1 hypothetical protein [Alphaproteobacteria bacterium]